MQDLSFVLTPEEAQNLIEKNPKNQDVLFPYLNGQDLNTNPNQSPSRWVINFFDWALSPETDAPKKPKGAPYASDYPDCLKIVEELVKPERVKNNRKVYRDYWWHYAEKRPALYETIKECDRIIAIPLVSKYFNCAWESRNMVYSHALGIIAIDSNTYFALIQNTFHEYWSREQGSRYTICEEARREILDRLLQLNHERYAEEVKLGLHDKKKKKKGSKSKKKITNNQEQLKIDL